MEPFIKKKIPFMIVVSIVVIIITTALAYVLYDSLTDDRMTAKEGLDIANDVAKEWDSSAILICVADGDDFNVDENGESYVWWYIYVDDEAEMDNLELFIVKVHPDNSYTTEILPVNDMAFNHEIEGWTIDSDKALDIAWAEPNFIDFREEYGVGEISMGLYYNNSQERAEWEIIILEDKSWKDDEYLLRIDAETGEILGAFG